MRNITLQTIREISDRDLVRLWAALTGRVARMRVFRVRKTGEARVLAILERKKLELLAEHRPECIGCFGIAHVYESTRVPTGRGLRPRWPDDTIIRLEVSENPKRPGTKAHARFSLYRPHMTARQYRDAVGHYCTANTDITFDLERGYITLLSPETGQELPRPGDQLAERLARFSPPAGQETGDPPEAQ